MGDRNHCRATDIFLPLLFTEEFYDGSNLVYHRAFIYRRHFISRGIFELLSEVSGIFRILSLVCYNCVFCRKWNTCYQGFLNLILKISKEYFSSKAKILNIKKFFIIGRTYRQIHNILGNFFCLFYLYPWF